MRSASAQAATAGPGLGCSPMAQAAALVPGRRANFAPQRPRRSGSSLRASPPPRSSPWPCSPRRPRRGPRDPGAPGPEPPNFSASAAGPRRGRPWAGRALQLPALLPAPRSPRSEREPPPPPHGLLRGGAQRGRGCSRGPRPPGRPRGGKEGGNEGGQAAAGRAASGCSSPRDRDCVTYPQPSQLGTWLTITWRRQIV